MRYVLLLLLLLAACTAPIQEPVVPEEKTPILKGVAGFIPANYPDSQQEDWENLFATLPEYGELFGVYTAWDDNLEEGIPQQVRLAYQLEGVTPVIGLGFEPDILDSPDTYMRENGAAFKEVAVNIAEEYQPEYLALGVEINRYWERSPSGFDDFLSTYSRTYDAVKEVSPDTKVFTIFQLDYMRGAAALSGRPHEKHAGLIERFGDKLDLVGFTVYPFLEYDVPERVPDDYFPPTNKHIIVTETGWPSESLIGDPTTEADQDAYVSRLWSVLPENTHAVIWSFPHDIGLEYPPFEHISLKHNNGTAKRAYSTWKQI